MLTVKHILTQKSLAGFDAEIVGLYEAVNVFTRLALFEPDDGPAYEVYQLVFEQPNGVESSIDTGRVYILNDHGKTVDNYSLKRPV